MLAVIGGKGGVGTTTTAAGLAVALGARGRRPVAVDADADMPNLHVVLGARPSDGVTALADGTPLSAATVAADRGGDVAVLPALPGAPVADALAHLSGLTRPVIVDCPAGTSRSAADPLRTTDAALIVAARHGPALEDAVKTARMARAVGTPVVGAIVVDAPGSTAAGAVGDVASLLGAPLLGRVPAVDGPPLAATPVQEAFDAVAGGLLDRGVV